MKAADAMQFDEPIERENEVDPACPIARLEREFLSAYADLHGISIVGHCERHRNRDVRWIAEEFVRRSLDLRIDDAFVVFELHDLD